MRTFGRTGVAFLLLAACLLSGCKQEFITEYDAPRENQERLVAVMIPRGPTTCWFFLLTGPAAKVEANKTAFDTFYQTVRFVGDKPKWDEPKGWVADPRPGRRFAIFHLGISETPVDVTITKEEGEFICNVQGNVNRWRGQLGLIGLEDFEVADFLKDGEHIRSVMINGEPGTLVDFTGPGGAKRKAPMGGSSAEPSSSDRNDAEITWARELPPGWEQVPDPRGKKRVVSFQIKQGALIADANIQVFPGNLGGVLANVTRWRTELGLPQVGDDELRKHLRPGFKLAGQEAAYADMTGTGDRAQRTLGVLATRGGKTWSIKMIGPKELVKDQQVAFDKFLDSIRFRGDQGDVK